MVMFRTRILSYSLASYYNLRQVNQQRWISSTSPLNQSWISKIKGVITGKKNDDPSQSVTSESFTLLSMFLLLVFVLISVISLLCLCICVCNGLLFKSQIESFNFEVIGWPIFKLIKPYCYFAGKSFWGFFFLVMEEIVGQNFGDVRKARVFYLFGYAEKGRS